MDPAKAKSYGHDDAGTTTSNNLALSFTKLSNLRPQGLYFAAFGCYDRRIGVAGGGWLHQTCCLPLLHRRAGSLHIGRMLLNLLAFLFFLSHGLALPTDQTPLIPKPPKTDEDTSANALSKAGELKGKFLHITGKPNTLLSIIKRSC